jgi:hypothetical protein
MAPLERFAPILSRAAGKYRRLHALQVKSGLLTNKSGTLLQSFRTVNAKAVPASFSIFK